jgi:hypothetical protein
VLNGAFGFARGFGLSVASSEASSAVLPCSERDSKGEFLRYKARLDVDGRKQVRGVDVDLVFAPTSRMSIVRLLLAVANFHDFEVYQADVNTAFLNGSITDEISVQQPVGLIEPGDQKVCKLIKSL